MKKSAEYLIDTDVLNEYLHENEKEEEPALLTFMKSGICFTTVLNAAELLLKVDSSEEKEKIIQLLSTLNVLGIHSRYCLNIDKYSSKVGNIRDALFCAAAEINKLPIVTYNKAKYISTGLRIIHPKEQRG
jgi:predicted nucleic acid-binding protein